MTTPTVTLYASLDDLKLVLDSTDAGTGTGAQLSDDQLNLALKYATDRVSVFGGQTWSDPTTVPYIANGLTLDIAAWYATTMYLKQKDMGPNNPVVLRYTEAMKILVQVRQGLISLEDSGSQTTTSPPPTASGATVINLIPSIFTGEDSNTAVVNDDLVVSVPADMFQRPNIINNQWIEYTG